MHESTRDTWETVETCTKMDGRTRNKMQTLWPTDALNIYEEQATKPEEAWLKANNGTRKTRDRHPVEQTRKKQSRKTRDIYKNEQTHKRQETQKTCTNDMKPKKHVLRWTDTQETQA